MVPAPMNPLGIHEPTLVNTMGHAVGALIFGIFIYLLLKDRWSAKPRVGTLSLTAAALLLVWNLASLIVIGLSTEPGLAARVVNAIGSSALSLLPAVLLHISPAGRYRWITVPGYLLGAAAVVIHVSEVFVITVHSHRLGLILITVGFGALTALAAVPLFAAAKGQDRRRVVSPMLGTMALFLFAISFVHFGAEGASRAWPVELLLHHAGIPLALVVLLQDYRFILLDAFLRFLASFLLALAVTFGAHQAAAFLGIQVNYGGNEFRQGLLLVCGSLALILFSLLRAGLQGALTRVLFRRPDLEASLEQLHSAGASAGDETQYLTRAGEAMAAFMKAPMVEFDGKLKTDLLFPVLASDLPELRDALWGLGAEVVVPLRLPQGDSHYICLGRRQGGRRYLSEDLHALARLGTEVTEQLERFRDSEVKRLVSQAELRALQSQIHPHFLFNALNTLYGVIPRQADIARRLVLNLADIFRYFLQTDRTFIPLEEELRIVEAYLEIESHRLGPKLSTKIEADPEILHVRIPILSIEPLVENAVKHGVAARAEGGLVRVVVKAQGGWILVRVEDSGRGFGGSTEKRRGGGVGLKNVERRLRLCCGPEAELRIDSSETGTSVEFQVPLAGAEVYHR